MDSRHFKKIYTWSEQISVSIGCALKYKFTQQKSHLIVYKICKFLHTRTTEEVQIKPEDRIYIEYIFYRPKPSNKIIILLNLFNEALINKIHFKMVTFQTAIAAMKKYCWFASVDLTDAFYSKKVWAEDCVFVSSKYQFCALVMGLASSPSVLTKGLKPAFAHLGS